MGTKLCALEITVIAWERYIIYKEYTEKLCALYNYVGSLHSPINSMGNNYYPARGIYLDTCIESESKSPYSNDDTVVLVTKKETQNSPQAYTNMTILLGYLVQWSCP